MDAATEQGSLPGFTDRLNMLCDTINLPGKAAPHSNVDLAAKLADRGFTVTSTYLGQLRSGRKSNPSAVLVGELAAVFGIPVAYFFTQPGVEDPTLRDQRKRAILQQAQDLSPDGLRLVLDFMDKIRREEGLDPQADTSNA